MSLRVGWWESPRDGASDVVMHLLHGDGAHHVLMNVADVVVGPGFARGCECLGLVLRDVACVELATCGSERVRSRILIGHFDRGARGHT